MWITEGEDGDCLVYVGGITKTMKTGFDDREKEELYNNIVDLHLKDGRVKKAVVKKERIFGRVLAVGSDSIEIEGYGELPLSPTFQVFQTYGTFSRKKPEDILVGYDNQEFVVSDGQVCAALIVRAFDADTIRVLLMDTGFDSLFHPSVSLTSGGRHDPDLGGRGHPAGGRGGDLHGHRRGGQAGQGPPDRGAGGRGGDLRHQHFQGPGDAVLPGAAGDLLGGGGPRPGQRGCTWRTT